MLAPSPEKAIHRVPFRVRPTHGVGPAPHISLGARRDGLASLARGLRRTTRHSQPFAKRRRISPFVLSIRNSTYFHYNDALLGAGGHRQFWTMRVPTGGC